MHLLAIYLPLNYEPIWVVLKVQEEGDRIWKLRKMTSRENRAITGLILIGAIGYLVYGVSGAVIGGIIGAVIGYFWD